MIKVKKRNGKIVDFDINKIINAISKANNEVEKRYQLQKEDIFFIAKQIEEQCNLKGSEMNIEEIQDLVETKLININASEVVKKYIKYRYERELVRKANTTDEAIFSLIKNENKELAEENSNKSTVLASTQRDYMAGIVSRDVTERILLPKDISEAHKKGILHFHR